MIGGEARVSKSMKLISENYMLPGGEVLFSVGQRFTGDNLTADLGFAGFAAGSPRQLTEAARDARVGDHRRARGDGLLLLGRGQRRALRGGAVDLQLAGVVAYPVPGRRSIGFVLRAPGGETDVSWGGASLGVSLFANGCDIYAWPRCRGDGGWDAGGPDLIEHRPRTWQATIDYDLDRGVWTGSGLLQEGPVGTGTAPVEFVIGCSVDNRKMIR